MKKRQRGSKGNKELQKAVRENIDIKNIVSFTFFSPPFFSERQQSTSDEHPNSKLILPFLQM